MNSPILLLCPPPHFSSSLPVACVAPSMPVHQAIIKPRLDLDLPPIKDFSFRQWNGKFQELTTAEDRTARDVFALTGHYTSALDGEIYRARLDDDTCKLREGRINQICDIDSVLGLVHDRFPVADHITFKYFMLPSLTHTLTTDLHLPGIHVFGQEPEDEVSLCMWDLKPSLNLTRMS